MYIPVSAIIFIGTLAFLLFSGYRQGIIDFVATVWNLLCSFLGVTAPATGVATSGIVGIFWRILAIILALALVIILFIMFLYVLAGSSIIAIGAITGHLQAAIIFLVALLTWGMFSTIPVVWGLAPLRWISRWIARPIAILLALFLLSGGIWYAINCFSPRFSESAIRSGNNTIVEIANKMDKKSLQMEDEAGKFARMFDEVYAVPVIVGRAPFFVKKGEQVLVIELVGQKANDRSEGKARIMLKNKFGQFDGGPEGWVPSRLLNWNWNEQQIKTPPETDKEKAGKEPVKAGEQTVAKKQGKMIRMFSENLKGGERIPVHFAPGAYSTPDEIYLSKDGKNFVCVGPGNFEVSKTDPQWMNIKIVQSGKVSIFEIQ